MYWPKGAISLYIVKLAISQYKEANYNRASHSVIKLSEYAAMQQTQTCHW